MALPKKGREGKRRERGKNSDTENIREGERNQGLEKAREYLSQIS